MKFDIATAIIGAAMVLCSASAIAAIIAAAEMKGKLCIIFVAIFAALAIVGAALIGGFGGGLQ